VQTLKVGVLGPLEVSTDDEPVLIGSAKERALLSLLALRAGAAVGVGTLIEGLWGDDPPRSARKLVQIYVSNLRRVLPLGSIVTIPDGYRLAVEPARVDTFAFAVLAAAGHTTAAVDPRAAVATLGEALRLWRGSPVAELADHQLGRAEATSLEETRRTCEEDLADARLASGEHTAAIADLEAAVAAEPLRERRWAQLMLALYRSGRQADALHAFQRLRNHLGEQIGVDPCSDLVALEEAIILHKPELDRTAASGRSREGQEVANNLPCYLSSFVGRKEELAEIRLLIASSRLVTLTGAGGSGKTRLALEAAAELLDGSNEGVFFTDLAPIAEPEQVARAAAAALGIREVANRSPLDTLLEVLSNQHVLVVLDNCEHVLDACADLVGLVERHCPRVQVVATSREPLGIDGEHIYRVRPLSLPSAEAGTAEDLEGSDAVELFVERARVRDSALSLDDSIAPLVASICRRLDGIPFGIELAAARLASMSLTDLTDRLDERFRLLTGGARNALPRQQTLQATFDWSFDLLRAPEQAVLCRLSVFVGGFGLEAAETVCQSEEVGALGVADLLGSLVNKSLVVTERSSGSLRYRLLETIRQYGSERLDGTGGDDEAAELRSAHAKYYLQLAETAAPELTGPRQGLWLKRLDLEWDNIRAALAYLSAEPDRTEDVLRLGAALFRFFFARQHRDPIPHLLAALERQDNMPIAARAHALWVTGRLVGRLLGFDDHLEMRAAENLLERSLAMAREIDDRELVSRALSALGEVVQFLGESTRATILAEEALDVARSVADPVLMSGALNIVAFVARTRDTERALRLEALAFSRRAGDIYGVCNQLRAIGQGEAFFDGQLEAARPRFEEALAIAEEIGASWYLNQLWIDLGVVLLGEGKFEEAARLCRKALVSSRRQGNRANVVTEIFALACCATGTGDYRRAAQLTGAFDVLDADVAEVIPSRAQVWTPLEQRLRDDNLARLREVLGEREFGRAYDLGRGLSFDEAVDLALGRVRSNVSSGAVSATGVSAVRVAP
jgi:predicted ATPase/DNA-binding SARP family transcriptional activator